MEPVTEFYGCVTKVENLWCVDDMGIKNTCILESRDAYPGYYDHISGMNRPRLIFIMSKKKYSLEEVTRMTAAVKGVFHHPFDAAYCEISMRGRICGGIRINGIDKYSLIWDIQTAYLENGMDLKKKERNIENEESVIKIRKFFKLKEVSDLIFMDAAQDDFGYFRVEEDLPWERFREIILRLRNNWSDNYFDAAKSYIYRHSSIIDLVRIYSKGIDASFLERIRDAYFKSAAY